MSEERGTYYAVMVVARWDWLTLTEQTSGLSCPIRLEDGGVPVGFLPVFADRAEAEAWAKGRWPVMEIATVKQEAPV